MKRTKPREPSSRRSVRQKVKPETGNETPRAMLNDLVLQNIFKCLGYQDLKTIRDVKNCQWLRNSKNVWWSRTKVTFGESGHSTSTIAKYLNESAITSNARNYKFHRCRGVNKYFLRSLGHSIKCLELVDCSLPSVDDFRNLIYTQCPNLEKLGLMRFHLKSGITTDVVEPLKWQKPQWGEQTTLKTFTCVDTKMPVSWMEFLSHFPNLQALEANLINVDIYKVVSVIRQHDPKTLKLHHLDINFEGGNHYEKSLQLILLDRNLCFEALGINFEKCKPETVVDILSFHAKSLKELRIYGSSPTYPQNIPLSQPFQNLETLSIGPSYYNVGFFMYTPHVRKVVLRNDMGNSMIIDDPNLRLDSCKQLTLPFHGFPSDLELTTFLNAFPNVEELETSGLDNSDFSIICERLPKLVSFNATHYSNVDIVGLLGFNPGSKVKNGARKPNITNLKALQTFSMNSGSFYSTNLKSSYAMIQHGSEEPEMKSAGVILEELRKLHHLKKFELKGYDETQIWDRICAKYSDQ